MKTSSQPVRFSQEQPTKLTVFVKEAVTSCYINMIASIGELQGKRVGVFGLSGNPPTGSKGHAGIVNFLVQTGIFDEVWILPVFQHMYSTKSSMVAYEHRIEMCKMSMEDLSRESCQVRVMTIERDAAEHYEQTESKEYRVGTVDVLDFILSHCPEIKLHLVLGTDTFKDLIAGKWKQSGRILSMVTLHVISRQGVETSPSASAPPPSAHVVHHYVPWLTEVSSSQMRAIYSTSSEHPEKNAILKDLLDSRVLEYIRAHHLYTPAAASV